MAWIGIVEMGKGTNAIGRRHTGSQRQMESIECACVRYTHGIAPVSMLRNLDGIGL